MTDSLRILLAESIDYAGMFPPAQLSLKHAVDNYVSYAQSPERWMLARMVIPASQLANSKTLVRQLTNVRPPPRTAILIPPQLRSTVAEHVGIDADKLPNTFLELEELGADSLDTVELVMELEEMAADFDPFDDARIETFMYALAQIRKSNGHRLAVIGTCGKTSNELLKNLQQDVQEMVEFQNSNENQIRLDTLEISVPSDAFDSTNSDSLANLIYTVRRIVSVADLLPLKVFFEVSIHDGWERSISAVLELLDFPSDHQFGLKIRTELVDQPAGISSEQVAFFIAACRDANIVWKATAGLHHPLRRCDAGSRNVHFGFLNLLAAAVLGWIHELNREQILLILTEMSIERFTFDQELISWGDYRATLDEIERGRQDTIISFGSCSFDEPRDGLRDLLLIA